MKLFTVYAPQNSSSLDRLIFVRQGFSLIAFIVPIVWLAVKRNWRALAIFLGLSFAIGFVGGLLSIGQAPLAILAVLASLFVGLEAAGLNEAALRRRGYRHVGSVLAPNRLEAEHRYLLSLVQPAAAH